LLKGCSLTAVFELLVQRIRYQSNTLSVSSTVA